MIRKLGSIKPAGFSSFDDGTIVVVRDIAVRLSEYCVEGDEIISFDSPCPKLIEPSVCTKTARRVAKPVWPTTPFYQWRL